MFQALLRTGRRDEVADYLKREELDDLAGHPSHKISYAQALLEFGEWGRSIKSGYETVSIAPDNPSVVMKYCGLVLKPSESRDVRFDDRVGAGAWVRLTSDQGETYERIVGEKADKPWGDAVALDNAFIRHAVGLKTGDFFTADGGFGITKTWTVSEVKPVWLHAFHVLSSTFAERFPGVAGFATIQMKDNNIQPTLDQIRKWSEGVRAQANLYLLDGIPACLVARNRTGGAIALADYLVSIDESFKTCVGTFDERELAFKTIKEHGKRGAMLDAFTAWRIAELDSFEIVREVIGPLRIPVVELDTIRTVIDEGEMDLPGEAMSITYQDGQYIRRTTTQDERRKTLQLHKIRLEIIEKNCESVSLIVPNELNEAARAIIDAGFAPDLASAILCREDEILLSDDMNLRRFAQGLGAERSVWLQAVLMAALNDEFISRTRYAENLALLAEHRHSFVSASAADFLEILSEDSEMSRTRFFELSRYIGSKDADFHSHTQLVAEMMNAVWKESSMMPLRKFAAVSLALRNLITRYRGSSWTHWAAGLWLMLDTGPREYFRDWLEGHFLDVGAVFAEVEILHRHISEKLAGPHW